MIDCISDQHERRLELFYKHGPSIMPEERYFRCRSRYQHRLQQDIAAYAGFHPVDEQRSEHSIEAWAEIELPDAEYGIVLLIELLLYVEKHRAYRRSMETLHPIDQRRVERFIDACEGLPGFWFHGARVEGGKIILCYDGPAEPWLHLAKAAEIKL